MPGRETRRVRLRDVADKAGVSPTTASFVLTGRDMRISEATRQHVLRTARELDYRPNLTARSLRTQESRTIGLVADSIATGHYGGELIRGSLTAALRHGHHLLVCESEGDPDLYAALVEDLVGRQVDGLIIATSSHDRVLAPQGVGDLPFILLNCESEATAPCIVPDEEAGGRAAASLLLDAGHRDRIWLVGEVPPLSLPGTGRWRGVTDRLAESDAELEAEVACPWWPEAAFEVTAEALTSRPPPEAILCLNDRIALGVTQALAEAGLVVPTDVSLVSFDDSELATWLRPALTSIALPELEMGRLAIESLLGPDPPPVMRTVPMPVRSRYSIAGPR